MHDWLHLHDPAPRPISQISPSKLSKWIIQCQCHWDLANWESGSGSPLKPELIRSRIQIGMSGALRASRGRYWLLDYWHRAQYETVCIKIVNITLYTKYTSFTYQAIKSLRRLYTETGCTELVAESSMLTCFQCEVIGSALRELHYTSPIIHLISEPTMTWRATIWTLSFCIFDSNCTVPVLVFKSWRWQIEKHCFNCYTPKFKLPPPS